MTNQNKHATDHNTDQETQRKQGNGTSVNTPKYSDENKKADAKRAS